MMGSDARKSLTAIVLLASVAGVCSVGCHDAEPKRAPIPARSAASAAAASSAEEPAAPRPSGCTAAGDKPLELGTIAGDVFALVGDGTTLYYISWEVYGGRGDIGTIRKDGGGTAKLTSLELEPRGLALDESDAYYTSGIRLMAIPKAGGDAKTVESQFAAEYIALHGADVYGVPGDYGPYDRVAKIAKRGGDIKELASSKRPAKTVAPSGFSRVIADESGVYVTDSSGGRVLRFPLAGGPPKVLGRQEAPFDLAVGGADLYFTLARKGELMLVPKAGGPVKKVASGLVRSAHLAGDDSAAYAVLAGKADGEAQHLARVAKSGEVTVLAQVPASDSVDSIALDDRCVYWADRVSSAKTVVYARAR
jgi:hypothetical protein